MFSLQRFFGKEDQFMKLFQDAAQASLECSRLLDALLSDPLSPVRLKEVQDSRLINKHICENVSELLINTFVTAFDREDLESISSALYKMPKPLVKFAERYQLANSYVSGVDFSKQLELAQRASGIVLEMVNHLAAGASVGQIKKLNNSLQLAETEADNLENSLLANLFAKKSDALLVIIIKDLHAMLEAAIDKARDAGTILTHVVLKNS